MNLVGVSIVERDGRVYCGDEDWGGVVSIGDALPCGCKFLRGDQAGAHAICEHKCHDLYRMIHHLADA